MIYIINNIYFISQTSMAHYPVGRTGLLRSWICHSWACRSMLAHPPFAQPRLVKSKHIQ